MWAGLDAARTPPGSPHSVLLEDTSFLKQEICLGLSATHFYLVEYV